jgi:hypothetical protein
MALGVSQAKSQRDARRSAIEQRWLSVLGVLSATVVALSSNVLGNRFYFRVDVTSAGLYSLSAPTLETVAGLSEEVQIIVLLGQGDPELGSVQRLLTQYEAASRLLRVQYVDPDRNPAQFVALRSRYRLTEGRAEQGQLVSDAALVVARGEARWIITADDILAYDAEQDTAQSRLELALTEGLRQVLFPQSRRVCFSRGHGEALQSLAQMRAAAAEPIAHGRSRNALAHGDRFGAEPVLVAQQERRAIRLLEFEHRFDQRAQGLRAIDSLVAGGQRLGPRDTCFALLARALAAALLLDEVAQHAAEPLAR